MIKKYFALSLIAASVAVVGCSSDDDTPTPTDPTTPPVVELPAADSTNDSSAFDVVANSADHTDLLAAINAAGLADVLDNPAGDFTIFAPTNDAFAALEADAPGTVAGLSTEELTRILQYHVVAGTVTSTQVSEGVTSATEEAPFTAPSLVADAPLTFTNPEGGLSVDGVVIATADLAPMGEGATGIVHVIGTILTPPAVTVEPPVVVVPPVTGEEGAVLTAMNADADGFTKVLAVLGANSIKLDEIDDTEDPWTIFAPTDAALAAGDVLLGDMVFVGPRQTPADLLADADGTITTFDGSKTYAIGGTDEASLTIGGAPATLLGGGTSIAYRLSAVPVAN